MEEAVALSAISVVDRLVEFLRRKAYLTPCVLQLLHFLRQLFPLLGVQRFSVHNRLVERLQLLDDGLLAFQVLLLFGVQRIEISLMFLIDDRRSGFEALP